MSKMPGYDADRKCPKCFNETVSTSFHGHNPFYDRCSTGSSRCDGPGAEHQHRTCRRCHYEWNEACPLEDPDVTP
jgi:hypothetical protein